MNDVIVKKKSDLVISEDDLRAMEYLSNGYSIAEVATFIDVNKRTLEARVNKLRSCFDCVNITQLVSEFFRKGLIK